MDLNWIVDEVTNSAKHELAQAKHPREKSKLVSDSEAVTVSKNREESSWTASDDAKKDDVVQHQ